MNTVIRHPLVRLGIALVSMIVSAGLIRSILSLWRKKDLVRQRRMVLERVEKEHAELQRKLEEATSSAFVEQIARNKLGLIKEGEKIVLMEIPTGNNETADGSGEDDLPNWKKWWQLFF